ncbi:hypothetical protein P43SY_005078 [Pythium insidiosum]|uniref:ubiquitinyl hydrolase 1 n=1 Tax=Pythium insidiosum TaxID=114742 RepID=A0AAD5Q6F7_PYTIN|nr:hypothetical protein P43SY_005078 [Pythium insidiosum]
MAERKQPAPVETLIAFGDFTIEEAKRALQPGEPDAAASGDEASGPATAPAPPQQHKSWAEALGVKATPPPPPPPPAWGGAGLVAETKATTAATAEAAIDPVAFEDAMQVALAALDVTAPAKEMKKRGLVNQGNTCFQNAIMQSILSCPPFVNLLVEISSLVAATPSVLAQSASGFRAWRHMLAFTREFEEPTLAQLQRLGASGLNDIQRKVPRPIKISGYFLDVLSAFQKSRGDQEDALEFLEFFLDYLHSEYEQSGLALPPSCEAQTKRVVAADDEQAALDLDDGWAEVGKGGKSALLRQNPVDAARSPINWLFKGTVRAELRQGGKKQSSITIEPFHCLHLNLDHDLSGAVPGAPTMKAALTKSYNVLDMIRKTFEPEVIEDSGRGGGSLKRFSTIDELPAVLTLNLKRFTYHPELGPVKLQQFVQYPASFEFPVDVLSPKCRAENGGAGTATATATADATGFTRFPPVYELFAVVSHHGKYVMGGHYTCVCRDNKDQWFQYDDEHVLSVSEAAALAENAYVLFYMRTNRPVTASKPVPPPAVSTAIPGASSTPKGGRRTSQPQQSQSQRGRPRNNGSSPANGRGPNGSAGNQQQQQHQQRKRGNGPKP